MYSTTTKELSIACLCVLEFFTLGQIKNVNVYRYSNFLKTDTYFRTNCFLVINLKQNRFEIN